jgi:hypothetical protein
LRTVRLWMLSSSAILQMVVVSSKRPFKNVKPFGSMISCPTNYPSVVQIHPLLLLQITLPS